MGEIRRVDSLVSARWIYGATEESSYSSAENEILGSHSLARQASIYSGLSYEERQFQRSELGSMSNLQDQTRLPRPCYYMLRMLGAWKPNNCHWICHVYDVVVFLLFVMAIVAIFMLGYVNKTDGQVTWRIGEILNSCCTILNLGCPYLFIRWYFRYGNYDKLVSCVLQTTSSNKSKVRLLSCLYTALSLLLWILGSTFFLVHWIPFFYKFWHYLVYVTAVIFTNGWWAAWLSVYGFVCNLHRIQAQNFTTFMQERYRICRGSRQEEKRAVGDLLSNYNELQRWVDRSQADFNKIVSFAITYHIVDMLAFSYAYWHSDFGEHYPVWQYVGGILFDMTSIAIKLCPVSLVSSSVHDITTRCGKECYQDISTLEYPKERFFFFAHVTQREQDFGLRILGVKITIKIAIGILVTIGTAMATFLRFMIPRLGASFP